MKLAIITSNHIRHKYFIYKLSEVFDIVGIIMEDKKRDYANKGDGTVYEERIKKYFIDRHQSELDFFGDVDFSKVQKKVKSIVSIQSDDINDNKYVNILKVWKPDIVSVFGSSILKDEIINSFEGKIINMHLGLSPYYRGSGTNFWPLYDEKPEYVGVTIHYLDKGIDSGKIIVQGRPDIRETDTIHSIGNKTIACGTQLMIETLCRFSQGFRIIGIKQDIKAGKLCKFKDCLPEHIIGLEDKFNNGLIKKYIQRIKNNPNDIPKIEKFIQ